MVKQGVGLHPGGLGSAHQSRLPGLCTCEHTQLLQGLSLGFGGGGQEAGDPTVVLSLSAGGCCGHRAAHSSPGKSMSAGPC